MKRKKIALLLTFTACLKFAFCLERATSANKAPKNKKEVIERLLEEENIASDNNLFQKKYNEYQKLREETLRFFLFETIRKDSFLPSWIPYLIEKGCLEQCFSSVCVYICSNKTYMTKEQCKIMKRYLQEKELVNCSENFTFFGSEMFDASESSQNLDKLEKQYGYRDSFYKRFFRDIGYLAPPMGIYAEGLIQNLIGHQDITTAKKDTNIEPKSKFRTIRTFTIPAFAFDSPLQPDHLYFTKQKANNRSLMKVSPSEGKNPNWSHLINLTKIDEIENQKYSFNKDILDPSKNEELAQGFYQRIHMVFQCAIHQKMKKVIFSLLGCAAFAGNFTTKIRDIFEEQFKKYIKENLFSHKQLPNISFMGDTKDSLVIRLKEFLEKHQFKSNLYGYIPGTIFDDMSEEELKTTLFVISGDIQTFTGNENNKGSVEGIIGGTATQGASDNIHINAKMRKQWDEFTGGSTEDKDFIHLVTHPKKPYPPTF